MCKDTKLGTGEGDPSLGRFRIATRFCLFWNHPVLIFVFPCGKRGLQKTRLGQKEGPKVTGDRRADSFQRPGFVGHCGTG